MKSWMELAECSHTMGPTLGTNFFVVGFTSPLLGDGLSTGPMVNEDYKLCNGSIGVVESDVY